VRGPLTIVVCRSRGEDPLRRDVVQSLADALAALPGAIVVELPHLYDLAPDGPAATRLRNVAGDLLVFAWLYPRAAFWVLDAHGVRGQLGATSLASNETAAAGRNADRETSARTIWCVDLRTQSRVEPCVAEAKRLLGLSGRTSVPERTDVAESPAARWLPVIDYARCTNCLECLNFCLFGVFGLDHDDRILVEEPDACRAGCPACSRICPADAILFPQHADPVIAGDNAAPTGPKLNLAQLVAGVSAEQLAELQRRQAALAGADDPLARLVDAVEKMEEERTKDEG
jgi:NAD-dependent dihydropyrimidine dehydrogenase PreA subunit